MTKDKTLFWHLWNKTLWEGKETITFWPVINSVLTPQLWCVKWIGNYSAESRNVENTVDQIGHNI